MPGCKHIDPPSSPCPFCGMGPTRRGPSLTKAGDTLQSAADRMADFILSAEDGEWLTHDAPVPYEVHMAALEAKNAIEDWTEARRG